MSDQGEVYRSREYLREYLAALCGEYPLDLSFIVEREDFEAAFPGPDPLLAFAMASGAYCPDRPTDEVATEFFEAQGCTWVYGSHFREIIVTRRCRSMRSEVEEPIFKVYAAKGHVYEIFADGRVRGFGDGALVINRIPVVLQQRLAEAELEYTVRWDG